MGGFSSEAAISLKSGQVVFQYLPKEIYAAYCIHISKEKWVYMAPNGEEFPINMSDFSVAINGEIIHFDCVFNAIHGAPGEDGFMQAYFELLDIPHSSCGMYQAALTFNKRDCLNVLKAYDVPTAISYALNKGDSVNAKEIIDRIGLPCFVKANRSGSSFGVFKVNKREELENFINKAFEFDNEILIESYLQGTEVSVGVMNYKDEIKVFGITELITENDFFDYDAKYNGNSKEITPANISSEQKELVSKLSVKIYKKLGMKGFTRSEFIIVKNKAYFLEINSIPGMTSESIFPKQAKINNISIKDLCNEMLEQALN